jgi:hypothetical protein
MILTTEEDRQCGEISSLCYTSEIVGRDVFKATALTAEVGA